MAKGLLDGKYKIIDTLGHGGMGTVYVAENVNLNTLWAIKEISKDSKEWDYRKEYEILKRLNHPALPRIFDIFNENGKYYIVEDYIEGINLKDFLDKNGPIDEKTAIDWILQLCNVLKYLHTLTPPIIYRDLKPSNIILTKNRRIKLVDFGIAREYKTDCDTDTVFIGTRGYAAPEQFGLGQSTVATDIFSLGITIYHLLTGHDPSIPPYKLHPLREIKKNLTEDMEKIIMKCTKEKPEERFQSIDELEKTIFKMLKRDKYIKYPLLLNKSFKKLVLCVLDNAEFAAELACVIAESCGLKTVIIDSSLYDSKMDIYLDISGRLSRHISEYNFSPLKTVISLLDKRVDPKSIFESATIKFSKNLYAVCGIFDKNKFDNTDPQTEKIIEMSYHFFDICIVVTNRLDINDKIIKLTDYIIAASHANTQVIREYRKFFDFIHSKYAYPMEKMKYVAFEYKKGVSIPVHILKKIFNSNNYLGKISYSPERERCRNANIFYADSAINHLKADYKCILNNFNIRLKTGSKEKILNAIKKVIYLTVVQI